MRYLAWAFITIGLCGASVAQAYIGPGVGAGTVAIVLGVLGSFLLAIVGIVWFPIKRWRQKRKDSQERETIKNQEQQRTEAGDVVDDGDTVRRTH